MERGGGVPSIVGRAALFHIVVPAILRILAAAATPPPFILLPPIHASAANTGVYFNHGVHEAVATTTMRVAATRTAAT